MALDAPDSRDKDDRDGLRSLVDALLEQIKALVEQNTTLLARIAELEARNGQPPQGPPKTPSNSSLPPSSGQKANRPETRKKGRKGRIGGRAEDVDLLRRAIHARTRRTIAMRSMIVGCRGTARMVVGGIE